MDNYLSTTQRNVSWFKSAHERNELNIKPPFQRNPVWVNRQKSYLIDTILNKFPIPEIYMQEAVDEKGKAKYIIVDGQQRIRAILEFLSGEFCMDSKDSPDFADMYFDDLSPTQKQDIFKYNFIIRILPDVADPLLREIFQRLNKNTVALNKQELRQATYWGPFIKTMNKLSDKDVWQELDVFTANDIRRMLDVEYISELSIAVLHGHQNKKQRLEDFYQIYEEEFDEKKELTETFDTVLKEINTIISEVKKSRWRKKSDFYTLFTVFAEHKDSLPLSSDKRSECKEVLQKFGSEIDYFVKTNKDELIEVELSDNVSTYGKGIRATTDLSSRKARFEGLSKELNSIFE
ncbi:DUF262 domain-containing protein [Maribacter sp. R77961]|uniref:DUF262 domain-containing protein n=1 Tax=Maribacter sp. R77961 TaxID=3093871 RepID=UPI0037CCB566